MEHTEFNALMATPENCLPRSPCDPDEQQVEQETATHPCHKGGEWYPWMH